MGRKDKKLSDPERIAGILSQSLFCHVAMNGKEPV